MRLRKPKGQRKNTCKCGEKARAGQRDCKDCHAKAQKAYRQRKKIANNGRKK